MRRLLVLLSLAVLLAGCGGWQKTARTGLEVMFETVRTTKNVTVALQHEKCKAVAAKCGVETPGKCPALKPCQDVRHQIEQAAIVANKIIAAGLMAVELGKEKDAKELMAKARAKLAELDALLKKQGVM